GDEVRPFRPGAFLAAQRTGAEIVPVGIAYEDDETVFYGEEPFTSHLLRVSSARRLRVALEIGEGMRDHADGDASPERARERVQALVHAARARLRGGRGA